MRKNDAVAGVWRASLWVFLAMIWGWMAGRRYRVVPDVEVGGERGTTHGSDDSEYSQDDDADFAQVTRPPVIHD